MSLTLERSAHALAERTSLQRGAADLTRGRLTAKAVMPTLWRVVHADGSVRGHISLVPASDGPRYAAKLILTGGVRTMFLGEFWQLADALDCFG